MQRSYLQYTMTTEPQYPELAQYMTTWVQQEAQDVYTESENETLRRNYENKLHA